MWRSKIALIILPFMLVFGKEKDRILFQHSFHVEDMELSCEECHTGVADADGLTWSIFPVMDDCLVCHDDDTADGSCEYCHTDPDNPLPIHKKWISSGLDFSHKKTLPFYSSGFFRKGASNCSQPATFCSYSSGQLAARSSSMPSSVIRSAYLSGLLPYTQHIML